MQRFQLHQKLAERNHRHILEAVAEQLERFPLIRIVDVAPGDNEALDSIGKHIVLRGRGPSCC